MTSIPQRKLRTKKLETPKARLAHFSVGLVLSKLSSKMRRAQELVELEDDLLLFFFWGGHDGWIFCFFQEEELFSVPKCRLWKGETEMWLMFRFLLEGNHYKEGNHPKCWIPVKYLPYQVISNKKPKKTPPKLVPKKTPDPPPSTRINLSDLFFFCVFLSWFPNFGSTWFLGSRFVFHPTTCGAVFDGLRRSRVNRGGPATALETLGKETLSEDSGVKFLGG